MKHTTLTLILVLFTFLGFSQNATLEGYTIDISNNDTIPYVTIGIVKKGIGTVSNAHGQFRFDPKTALDTDTVQLSSIGYETRKYTVATLRKMLESDPNIQFREHIEILEEVVFSTKKEWKQKRLGNDSESAGTSMGFTSNLGSELGRKINIRKKPTRLLEFKTFVALNTYDSIKLRFNIYTANGKFPGIRINTQNIYASFEGENGPLTIDLEPYNILVEEDIFITLEWVDNYGDGQFRITSPIGTSGIKHKRASADDWRTIPFTLAYSLLVEY